MKEEVQVGDIVHLNCTRYPSNYSNYDAEVMGCLAQLAKVKFL